MRDVHILCDRDSGSVQYVNAAVLSLLGISAAELTASPEKRFACIHPSERNSVNDQYAELVGCGTPYIATYRFIQPNGTTIRVEEDARIVRSDDGGEQILISIRARGQREWPAQNQHLKAQYNVANILAEIDDTSEVIDRILSTLGMELGWQICEYWSPSEDFQMLSLRQVWSDEHLVNAAAFVNISKQLKLERNWHPQGKVWTGGAPLWTKSVCESEPEQRRQAAKLLGLATGLWFPIQIGESRFGIIALYSTEAYAIDTDLLQTVDAIGKHLAQYMQRGRARDEYAASQTRFRQMFEQNESIKLVINPDTGAIVDANPAAARFYGYSIETLQRMKISQINTLTPEEIQERMESVVAEEKSQFIFNHRLASGSIRQVEVHSSPLNIEGRNLLYSTIIDVTDKLRTEAALRESDERIRLVFRHTPTAIAIFDRNLRYLFVTTAWIAEHQLGTESVIGHSCRDVHPNLDERWLEMFNTALAGETVHSEDEKMVRADSTIDWIRCVVSPWRNSLQEIGGIIVFTESITKEKLAREALSESEERYRSLFENLIDGFALHKIVLDESGVPIDYLFLEVNDAFEEMTGLKRENLVGRAVTEVIPGIEHASENWIGTYGRVALTGETMKFERESKELGRWYSVSAYSPQPGYFVTVFEDITQRKNAEAALREHQRATVALLGNLPGMAYRCRNDRDWTMEYVSEGCEELTGYNPSDLTEKGKIRYNDCIHPDDRAFVWNEVQIALERSEPYRLTYRLITRDGRTKWVWEQGSAIGAGDGTVVTIEGFIADITDRKNAEDALQSREEHFRALIDNSSDIITLVDTDGRILYMSPSVERILGYTPEELRGTIVFKVLAPGDRKRTREIMRRALIRGGVDISLELRARHKDGSLRILDVAGRNLLQDPHVGAIVVNSRDITDRRMIETERSQLATAVEQATESIVITDTKGEIIYVNSAFEKISGYSREESVGHYVSMLKSGEHSPQFYHDIWTILNAGEPWVGRFKNRRKNGVLYEEECAISPIKDASGKVINFVAVKRDITKEVELEDRLRQAQKLEAVGRLASGIAHDFNNLLAGIRGFGELIYQEAGEESKLRGYSEEIVRAASRAADLTSQLLAFARKGNYLTVPVDIHETITEVTNILRHTIDRRIEILTELAAGPATVKGDPSQIQSAILNLGVNSRDAMPEGGRLTFKTHNVQLDEEYCRRHSLDYGPGAYIAITVSDTGIGIDEAILAHIFDPFFTTKEQGQGTGLGLAGVYGCVRNHHGTVEVSSEVGRGSAFTLYLPVSEAVSIADRGDVAEVSLDGRERILVVDDEEIVRHLAEKMLTKVGYKVITCVDGEEAVQLYRTAINSIDLVLLDMMMPKMNGRDTYAALKKFNPAVRVLMMSGFADTDVQQIINQGIAGFVHKPFQMKVFLAKVREALDSKTVGRTVMDRR